MYGTFPILMATLLQSLVNARLRQRLNQTDASNMQGGSAKKLFVPETADEIAEILREALEILDQHFAVVQVHFRPVGTEQRTQRGSETHPIKSA